MESARRRYLKRFAALRNERTSWVEHWKELASNFTPFRSRFEKTDRNRGAKLNGSIYNGTPIWASRVLAAGMMAGVTSPARPWFRLGVPETELDEYGPVRIWLHEVEERMRLVFAKSNFYNSLHAAYGDLSVFGTAPIHMEEDEEDVLRCEVLPVGQYALANSARRQVDTCYRELSMTVGQLAEKFGVDKLSPRTRDLHAQGHVDEWVEVLYVTEPRRDFQPGKLGPRGMAWRSCWMEIAGDDDVGLLRESGYMENPVMAPRWTITGEDVYGRSPAMDGLGDAKSLQLKEKRKAEVVDKIVRPPMRAPSSMQHARASLLPGDVNYYDGGAGGAKFEPALDMRADAIQVIGLEVREDERRIKAALYADLWLQMLESNRRQVTAREVAERHEEKMMQLGPVVERLQDELLDPAIDRAFGILARRGLLPEAPPELEGIELKVEHISILAQAQKLLGISGIERGAAFVGNLAAVDPEVLDRFDKDEAVKEYFSALGTPPRLLVPDELVQKKRAARAKAAQQQAAMEQAAVATQGAKTLSETDMQGDSALNRLVGALGGVATTGSGGMP